jgi:hypothetical protein
MSDQRDRDRRNAKVLLEGCERLFAAGKRETLLEAVYWAAVHGVELPAWAASAFRQAYEVTVFGYGSASWDDAFGKPHGKKRRKLLYLRIQHQKRDEIFHRVMMLRHHPGHRGDIFQRVADDMDLTRATVKRIFERHARGLGLLRAAQQTSE